MKILAMALVLMVGSSLSFAKEAENEFKMKVTDNGYEPSTLKVKAKTPVVLKITRTTNGTCAREITVPSQKLKVDLPLNKEVTVKIAALEKGEIKFGCAMDMMIGGVINAQ